MAFLEFKNMDDAIQACRESNNKDLFGSGIISVQIANSQRKKEEDYYDKLRSERR